MKSICLFRPFRDEADERDSQFTDHVYQQNLRDFERSHTSKSIKNNLKISELKTDPSYAFQIKRVCSFRFLFFSTNLFRLIILECNHY